MNNSTSGGNGAPGGRHRDSVRAAAAATSGDADAALPNTRQPRSHRSPLGSAATAAATEDSAA
jgi:hypothetical protein